MAAQNVYVASTNDNVVYVLNSLTNGVIANIRVGQYPCSVAAQTLGTKIYVANCVNGDHTISVVNAITNKVTATIDVGANVEGVTIAPGDATLYANTQTPNAIKVIDTSINTVTDTITLPDQQGNTAGIAITSDGRYVYVPFFGATASILYVIDTISDLIVTTVQIGNCPAIGATTGSPDAAYMYVADACGGTLDVVSTQNNTVTARIPVSTPSGVAVAPDGSLVYVSTGPTNTVAVIDSMTNAVITTIPVPNIPEGLSVTPDGSKVYAVDYGGTQPSTVSVISTASNTVVATVNNVGSGSMASAIGSALNPSNRAQEKPPIWLGVSGSNEMDCCTGTGTLGSLVKDAAGNTYILSNNHVLARTNQGQAGEKIIHRGFADTRPACSTKGTRVVAKLSSFVPIDFTGKANTIDAAIAQTVPKMINSGGGILGVGFISTATATPTAGMSVLKAGRTTGLTSGEIESVGVAMNVPYSPCGKSAGTALFENLIVVVPGSFAGAGDSGSLILKKVTSGSPNPVGLEFASDPSSGRIFASPIDTVLAALNVSFVGNVPTSVEIENSLNSTKDPRMENAWKVKAQYSSFLFSLKGVVGHGVGYSKSAPRHVVIRLYVDDNSPGSIPTYPPTVQGIPIEIEKVGHIRVD